VKKSNVVWRKLKQLRFRYMKTYLEKNLKRTPDNCLYNHLERFSSGKKVGLCSYVPEDSSLWGFIICDGDTSEGVAQARRCEVFCTKRSPDELKEEFDLFMSTSTMGQIAYHYRDMAALMWVLETSGEGSWHLSEDLDDGPSVLTGGQSIPEEKDVGREGSETRRDSDSRGDSETNSDSKGDS